MRCAPPNTVAWAALVLPFTPVICGDLPPCVDVQTFRDGGCAEDSVAACWSSEPHVPWACWSLSVLPLFMSSGELGSTACKKWPTKPGSGTLSPYYDGACSFKTAVTAAAPPVLLSWDEAYFKADETLAMMEEQEKYSMMQGVGWTNPPPDGPWWDLQRWYYVGNTVSIPRLDIPSLNLQDASAGFRTMWEEVTGTVTCWPSMLALGATWDVTLVRTMSVALAQEMRGKGSNGVLGPGVNVHRGARNGRNFEYIGGEDPYLGGRLAEAYIAGMQSQGIMAVVKHWVFNEQETNRAKQDSVVDQKTAWELYYPPFQAAVDAGVVAVMCSYNKVNGKHACENEKTLTRDLKRTMRFQGFIQSDWWAAHSTAVAKGLDQDMPGIADYGIGMIDDKKFENDTWYGPDQLSEIDQNHIDASVRRILAAVYKLQLVSRCTPPNCKSMYLRNVTNYAHVALARSIAAESIVLLKNIENTLPIGASSAVNRIAVLGPGCSPESYDPNGVGQGQGNQWNTGDYYSGGGSGHIAAKSVVTPLEGIRRRARSAGIEVLPSHPKSTKQAIALAKKADLTIVCAGTTSGEAEDRPNLTLDDGADELIQAVADSAKSVVVIAQIPGAIIMPWKDNVSAIMVAFLPGQEAGSAWGDVLFGDHAPTGRLPIMMPETENDTVKIGQDFTVIYSEGMKTSYRNKQFQAAYPFGHGLTYTTFSYHMPRVVPCTGAAGLICVLVSVQNDGLTVGRTVAQLYLDLGPEAEHPTPLLRGFQKTSLMLPAAVENVTFVLTVRDLSYYQVATRSWELSSMAIAHIGESSADIRHTLEVPLGGSWTPVSWQAGWELALAVVVSLAVCTALGVVFAYRKYLQGHTNDINQSNGFCTGHGSDTEDETTS